MSHSQIKSLIIRELSVLLAFNSSDRPWHLPLAAALAISLPIFISAYLGQLTMGIQASLGAMIILNLPSSESICQRQLTLLGCGLAMSASFGLGLVAHNFAPFKLAIFAIITLMLVLAGRYWKMPPPGTLFMMMAAAIALFMPVALKDIPAKVAVVASGSAFAWVMGLLYSMVVLRQRTQWSTQPKRSAETTNTPVTAKSVTTDAQVTHTDRTTKPILSALTSHYQPGLFLEAAIVTLFVVLALAVALILKLSHPYWVPVSCFIIMQGMHLRTMWVKQLHRSIGTAIGIVVAWFLLALSLPPMGVAMAIFCMMCWIETVIVRHYGLAVIMITPLTIFIAEYGSGHSFSSVEDGYVVYQALMQSRLLDTVLGCLIALLGGVLMHANWVRERLLTLETSLIERFTRS